MVSGGAEDVAVGKAQQPASASGDGGGVANPIVTVAHGVELSVGTITGTNGAGVVTSIGQNFSLSSPPQLSHVSLAAGAAAGGGGASPGSDGRVPMVLGATARRSSSLSEQVRSCAAPGTHCWYAPLHVCMY